MTDEQLKAAIDKSLSNSVSYDDEELEAAYRTGYLAGAAFGAAQQRQADADHLEREAESLVNQAHFSAAHALQASAGAIRKGGDA